MGMEKLASELDLLLYYHGPHKSLEIPNLNLELAKDIKEAVMKQEKNMRGPGRYSYEIRPVIDISRDDSSIKNYTLIIKTNEDAPNKV